MTDFLIFSDLHDEFSPFVPPRPEDLSGPVDAVLLAGDAGGAGTLPRLMVAIRDALGVPVYAVEGNHDLWRSGRRMRTWQKIRDHAAKTFAEAGPGPELRILRAGQAAIVGDTRIIGATLWTNGRLGDEDPITLRERLKDRMNDYRKMTIHEPGKGIWRRAIPEDLFAEHRKDLSGILAALDTPHDGPTIVMTHHVPLAQVISPVLTPDGVNLVAGYGSDLGAEILTRKFDAWVYGHSHQPEDVVLETAHGSARFLSNPRGYPHERHAFDPFKRITVSAEEPAPALA